MKVRLWHTLEREIVLEELRNVTEVHYNYRRRNKHVTSGEAMIAFESDIHGTGINYGLSTVVEFEAVLETEVAESFQGNNESNTGLADAGQGAQWRVCLQRGILSEWANLGEVGTWRVRIPHPASCKKCRIMRHHARASLAEGVSNGTEKGLY